MSQVRRGSDVAGTVYRRTHGHEPSFVQTVAGDGVEVCGALCLVDVDGLPLLSTVTVNGVPVIGARRGEARASARRADRRGDLGAAREARARSPLRLT